MTFMLSTPRQPLSFWTTREKSQVFSGAYVYDGKLPDSPAHPKPTPEMMFCASMTDGSMSSSIGFPAHKTVSTGRSTKGVSRKVMSTESWAKHDPTPVVRKYVATPGTVCWMLPLLEIPGPLHTPSSSVMSEKGAPKQTSEGGVAMEGEARSLTTITKLSLSLHSWSLVMA